MKCLILAAGYATRLYPLTENFPKPLLKVGNKTILDHLIDDIETSGKVDEYIIISNHKYYNFFTEWASGKTNISVIDDGSVCNENRLGAVRDIQFAIEQCSVSDDILVIAGDNVLDFSLTNFIKYAENKKAPCIMRYYEKDYNKLIKCGVVEIDEDDRIISMTEKSKSPKSNWCCPPFYFYTGNVIPEISNCISSGCPTDAPGSLAAWLSSEMCVYAMEMPGSRYDIGNLESYEYVNKTYKGILK